MNAPERNQIGTPDCRIEDSAFLCYINNMSPIKPVKPMHITQTVNSLASASVPTVFTSPHVKEWRFLRRHHLPDLSKPDFCGNGDEANRLNTCVGVLDSVQVLDCPSSQESFDPGFSIREVIVPFSGTPNLASESNLPHGSTDDLQKIQPMGLTDSCEEHQMEDTESDSETVIVPSNGTPNLLTDLLNYLKYDYESEGSCQVDQKIDERAGCDWENSISDASDVLIFDTFSEAESLKEWMPELVHHEIGSFASLESNLPHGSTDNLQNTQPMGLADSCEEHQMEDTESESEAVIVPSNGIPNLAADLLSYLKYDYGSLDCNPVPSHGNNIDLLAEFNRSPIPPFHFVQEVSEERQHSFESEIDIQGICQVEQNKDEGTSSSSLNYVGLEIFSADNGSLAGQGAFREFKFGANEEFNLSSPKKKKRKYEISRESEGCKRCSCKKSKCLKLYCECFAAGVYCMDSCYCQECFNKPIHEDTVMAARKKIESRNPLAFVPKVSRRSESVLGIGDKSNKTSSSAWHKRGCNCKKSGCQKKYCECYQGGVGCSINCRCEGCKNEFGLNPSLAKDKLALSNYTAHGSDSLSVGLAGGVSPEVMYCSRATNSYFPTFPTSRAPLHFCNTSVPNCAVWEHSAAGVGALGGMPLEDSMRVDLVEECNSGSITLDGL